MKLKITILLLGLYYVLIGALITSIMVPTFHLDGAFQTASGLFRLNSGQLPGKDFFPYLGIGPILTIFPIFKLAGSDLTASTFAATFITNFLAWISISTIIHLALKNKLFISSLCIGSILLLILTWLCQSGLFLADKLRFDFLIEPGNSLKPVRSSAPYILGILTYFISINPCPNYIKKYVAGVSVGVFMLWSNDYALPTVATFSLFYCIYFYRTSVNNWLTDILIFSFVLISTWLILLVVITAGHAIEFLKYNFIDIATDQWWFFAPYYDRIFHLSDLIKLLNLDLIILLILLIYAYKTNKIEPIILCLIGFSLYFGGALASIGGHYSSEYFDSYRIWSEVIIIAFSLNIIIKSLSKNFQNNQYSSIKYISYLGVTLFLLIGNSISTYKYSRELDNVQNNDEFYYVNEFGGYLNVEWRKYIEFMKQNKNKHVIEEYWGLSSALNKTFSSWPVDSAIHALGDVRKKSAQSLAEADYIVTTKTVDFSIWQHGSVSQNFWFYKELYLEWEPVLSTPNTTLWKKLPSKRILNDIECQITKNKDAFIIKTDVVDLINVTLNYSITAQGRHLSLVKNNLSYASDAAGYVSINPKSDNVSIPILSRGNKNETYDIKIIGGENSEIFISFCNASRFIIDSKDGNQGSVLTL